MTNFISHGPFFIYKKAFGAQTVPTTNLFLSLFNDNNFSTIIEIGTHRGGLSLWINDNKPFNCKFVTVDITTKFLEMDPKQENLDFWLGDCFTTLLDDIKKLILNEGQVLLLCDGGDKHLEFSTFAPMLKLHDVIMIHDFMETPEIYEKIRLNVGWPSGPESNLEYLTPIINTNSLTPYFFDEAKHCFWGCFKKTVK
jgi:hypothetical protein